MPTARQHRLTVNRKLGQVDAKQTLPRFTLVGQGTNVWDVAILVENLWTFIAAHQLTAIQANGTPVIVWVVFVAIFFYDNFPVRTFIRF